MTKSRRATMPPQRRPDRPSRAAAHRAAPNPRASQLPRAAETRSSWPRTGAPGRAQPPRSSTALGDRVVEARAGLVRGLGTFPVVTEPDREVHAHRQEHLRHGVVELDEMLGQFKGDVT